MAAFVETVVAVLEPYVGRTVADTCVRATALSLGKTSDSLDVEDFEPLAANVRRLLGAVAPLATIETIVADIERRVA